MADTAPECRVGDHPREVPSACECRREAIVVIADIAEHPQEWIYRADQQQEDHRGEHQDRGDPIPPVLLLDLLLHSFV